MWHSGLSLVFRVTEMPHGILLVVETREMHGQERIESAGLHAKDKCRTGGVLTKVYLEES